MSEEYIPSAATTTTTTTTTDWCSRFCSRILPIDVAIYFFCWLIFGWYSILECIATMPSILVCEKPHKYFVWKWNDEHPNELLAWVSDEIIVVTCIIWSLYNALNLFVIRELETVWKSFNWITKHVTFVDLGHRVDANIEIDTQQTDV